MDLTVTADFKKFDKGKARLDLIPPEFVRAIGEAMQHGADKYGDKNWEQGTRWGRYYAPLLRHLNDWWAGLEKDKDSGLHPLAHAGACLAILIGHAARGLGEDDRPNSSQWLVARMEETIEQFKDAERQEREVEECLCEEIGHRDGCSWDPERHTTRNPDCRELDFGAPDQAPEEDKAPGRDAINVHSEICRCHKYGPNIPGVSGCNRDCSYCTCNPRPSRTET